MRKLFLTTIAAIGLTLPAMAGDGVAVTPTPGGPSGGLYGWVAAVATNCHAPNPQCVIMTEVAGANVRLHPDGAPFAAFVNGTPMTVFRADGVWVFVRIDCPSVLPLPTGLFSDNAGVPLLTCGG